MTCAVHVVSIPPMEQPDKRSPVPSAPLPQAGDSLRDEHFDLFFGSFDFFFTAGLILAVVAAGEWAMYWMHLPRAPWFWTFFALVFCGLAARRWFRIAPQLRRLKLGIRGERHVGRMLNSLGDLGYTAFHDIPGDGFNVDHVLVGPGGVFAIETKTRMMPHGRRGVVDYDGKRVLVGGHAPDRDPVAQAQASADHIRDVLKSMTSRDVFVRPVVLFPGWWVNRQPRGCRTWVLNPKNLRGFLMNEDDRLSREDIALFSDRLMIHLAREQESRPPARRQS